VTAVILFLGFWVVYTYAGYFLVLLLWGRLKKRRLHPGSPPAELPSAVLVIPVHNEARHLERKLENALSLEYPRDRLEVVAVDDGSTDGSSAIIERYRERGVRLIALEANRGKITALNRAIPLTGGAIIVFTDATAEFAPDALGKLAEAFADPDIGAVSGQLVLREETPQASGTVRVDAYWKLEKAIRKAESKIHSVIGATGAIWALRREFYRALPSDTILDDVALPLQAVRAGRRLLFAEEAVAYEMEAAASGKEFRRKVRTLAGNYQLFRREPWIFNPAQGIAFQVVSHKLLRLLAPFALAGIYVLSWVAGFRALALAQTVFYLAALEGWRLTSRHRRCPPYFSLPFTFCLLNCAALGAFIMYFFAPRRLRW